MRYTVRLIAFALAMIIVTAGTAAQEGLTVYVTGTVRASLLAICPCADSYVLQDNSLGEDLYLTGDNLQDCADADVEIVGTRVDCGDCVKIDINWIRVLPPKHAYGDLDGDNQVTLMDIVWAINYLFRGGPQPPNGWRATDLDADGRSTMTDVVRLVTLVYRTTPLISFDIRTKEICAEPNDPNVYPYDGCKFTVSLRGVPLDTGTVDGNGLAQQHYFADKYDIFLYPPESSAPPAMIANLRMGDATIQKDDFRREYQINVIYVEIDGAADPARLAEIVGYFDATVLSGASAPPGMEVVELPPDMHFDYAIDILEQFPEIVQAVAVLIPCP